MLVAFVFVFCFVCLFLFFEIFATFLYLFLFFGFFEVFAGVVAGAVSAIAGRFTDGLLRGEGGARAFIAGADSFFGLEVGCSVGKLSGDLEPVKHESGAAGIHIRRIESGEDLGEGDLDAAVVFDGGQREIVACRRTAITTEIVVVVAVRLVMESWGVAFLPAWHDVSAFVVHDLFSRVPHPYSVWKFGTFSSLRKILSAKYSKH